MNIIDKKILYDGLETQKLYSEKISFNGKEFFLKDILENKLIELKSKINSDCFDEMISEFGFENKLKNDFLKDFEFENSEYKSKEELDLYFLEIDGEYCIFSFGEKQPCRYLLYFEGTYLPKM